MFEAFDFSLFSGETHVNILNFSHRIWIWVQPAHYSDHAFYWSRDSIYIAIILLGLGGAVLMVLSLSMISMLVGEYSVRSSVIYCVVIRDMMIFLLWKTFVSI